MTKEKARELLESWLSKGKMDISLPIVDEVLTNKVTFDNDKTTWEAITFLGLIKVAYNLKDNENTTN